MAVGSSAIMRASRTESELFTAPSPLQSAATFAEFDKGFIFGALIYCNNIFKSLADITPLPFVYICFFTTHFLDKILIQLKNQCYQQVIHLFSACIVLCANSIKIGARPASTNTDYCTSHVKSLLLITTEFNTIGAPLIPLYHF